MEKWKIFCFSFFFHLLISSYEKNINNQTFNFGFHGENDYCREKQQCCCFSSFITISFEFEHNIRARKWISNCICNSFVRKFRFSLSNRFLKMWKEQRWAPISIRVLTARNYSSRPAVRTKLQGSASVKSLTKPARWNWLAKNLNSQSVIKSRVQNDKNS